MGTVYPELDERLISFITSQPVFFVATAPCLDAAGPPDASGRLDASGGLDASGDGGHVNVSPKGYRDTFAVLDPRTVARTPKILRIYGRGRAVTPADPDWAALAAHFDADPGSGTETDRGNQRAIIVVAIDRIADSCGYAVPVMELTEERDLLSRWAQRRSAEDLAEYRVKHNTVSIDGLPALG